MPQKYTSSQQEGFLLLVTLIWQYFVVCGAERQLVVFCLLDYECALGGLHEKVILEMQRHLGENI